jgi:lysozyme family protein
MKAAGPPAAYLGWLATSSYRLGGPTGTSLAADPSTAIKNESANSILGLYVSGALLMQHSIGPRTYGDLPVLALIAFVLALWLTFRLVRGLSRPDRH